MTNSLVENASGGKLFYRTQAASLPHQISASRSQDRCCQLSKFFPLSVTDEVLVVIIVVVVLLLGCALPCALRARLALGCPWLAPCLGVVEP
jgi:hypothetical protein